MEPVFGRHIDNLSYLKGRERWNAKALIANEFYTPPSMIPSSV